MSRSRRKPYIYAVCMSPGEMGKWKRGANRVLRHTNKSRVNAGKEPVTMLEINDLWGSPADGGRCYVPLKEGGKKYTRK